MRGDEDKRDQARKKGQDGIVASVRPCQVQ